ncbi:MAG: zinc ribbon domain-containing protein, partial [Candidatus Heimdallarchaeota archaeon]|nr:zinc ribbon domain-containing protein [Candidatus Heimdallarchaeota archaeon]
QASEISGIVVKVRFSRSPDTLSSVSHGTIDTIGSSSHTHRMIYFDKKWGSSRLEVYIKWNEHIWQIYSEWMKIFSVRPDNIFNRYNYVFLPIIALSSSVLAYFLFTRYLKKRNLPKLPPLCQECDFQLEPDSKFCPNCGKKL